MIHIYVLKEKSRTMKFIHLSPPTADFSSELQSQIRILNGNILYITHEIDKLMAITRAIQADKGLQKQVDEYFDEDTEHIPEEKKD